MFLLFTNGLNHVLVWHCVAKSRYRNENQIFCAIIPLACHKLCRLVRSSNALCVHVTRAVAKVFLRLFVTSKKLDRMAEGRHPVRWTPALLCSRSLSSHFHAPDRNMYFIHIRNYFMSWVFINVFLTVSVYIIYWLSVNNKFVKIYNELYYFNLETSAEEF